MRESFKMELEFYDQTRAEVVHDYWTTSVSMFKKRLEIYLNYYKPLFFKQENFMMDARRFLE